MCIFWFFLKARGTDSSITRAVFMICAESLPKSVSRDSSLPQPPRLQSQHLLPHHLNHLIPDVLLVWVLPLPARLSGFPLSCNSRLLECRAVHRCFHPVGAWLLLRWCFWADVLLCTSPLPHCCVFYANTRLHCCFLLPGENPIHGGDGGSCAFSLLEMVCGAKA